MKKHIIISALFVVLFPLCSFGQDSLLNNTNDSPLFFIGADFSIIPFSYGGNNADALSFSTPLQYSSGLSLNFKVKNRYDNYAIFKTGILFDVLNNHFHLSRSTVDDRFEQADLIFRKRYLGVPVLWGHSAHLTDNTCYVFQIGLALFIEIGNSFSYTSNGNWEQALANWKKAYDNEKGRYATMLYLSYGHERRLNKSMLLKYEVYWQHRFNQQGFSNEDTGRPFRHYDVFGLGIGVGWIPGR